VEWWNTLVHLVLPAVLAPAAVLVLLRLDVLPAAVLEAGARRRLGLFVLSFLVADGFGAGYEVYGSLRTSTSARRISRATTTR
jgi:hypothetical protein